MPHRLFDTTFSRILFGITLTAILALAISQLISFFRLQQSFEQFQHDQMVAIRRFGSGFMVSEEVTLPEDLIAFADDYKNELSRHVIFSFAVGFLLSVITGIIISSQIVNPLHGLKRTITMATRSRYTIRAPETGSKEIREVNRSFNNLIQELEDQEISRRELITDISHELKTPITRIKGQLEGMLDGVYDVNKINLKRLITNINQLDYLISALYEANRLAVKDIDLNPQPVTVLPVVESSTSGLNQKPIRIKLNIPPKLKVTADPNRFKQIIDNLINNAYKYTHKGTITITANKKRISIADTGPGIDPAHVTHIFKRLYRVDKSRSRKTGGLGLGLYIVKRLVDLHGWTIEVKSKQDEGTTFTIYWG